MPNTNTTRNDSTEPTASADWRREYAVNAVPVPDGGREILPNVGNRVADREDDEAELIILDVHAGARADKWTIRAMGDTVADHNPTYAPDSSVVEAVYTEDAARLPSWQTVADLRAAVEANVLASYVFPAGRVAVPGGVE